MPDGAPDKLLSESTRAKKYLMVRNRFGALVNPTGNPRGVKFSSVIDSRLTPEYITQLIDDTVALM